MRLTPYAAVSVLRAAGVAAAVAAAAALTGPFHYNDLHLPFPDTVAHALLFYALTVIMFAALPRSRAADLALAMVFIGAASEVAQAMVGREMSLHDLAGDCLGIGAAYLPVQVTRLRQLFQAHPNATFSEIAQMDRRRGRRAETPAAKTQTP